MPTNVHSIILAWDKDLFNTDHQTIFRIIDGANSLKIGGLLLTGCKIVADMIREGILQIPLNYDFPQEVRDLVLKLLFQGLGVGQGPGNLGVSLQDLNLS